MTARRARGPLRHGRFRIFLGARFTSLLGSAIAPIALVFAVLDLSDSPSAVGIVLAARGVPIVAFLLFGGVLADRLPRQVVLVVSNGACFFTQGVAATLLITGQAQVWHLVIIEALNGTAAAFTFPAVAGIVPQLVERGELQQANALSGMARNVAQIGGASAGGAIVAVFSSGVGLAVDAASFAVAALLLAKLDLPPMPRAGESSVLAELAEGWTEFIARQWVWVVVAGFCLLNAIQSGAVGTLGPVIADDTFGRAGWGLVLAAESAGLAVGTVVMLRYRPQRPMVAGMVGMFGFVPVLFALGVQPHLALLIPFALLAGGGISVFGISWETALQQHIPADKLSRVFSYDALGSFVAIPIGQVVAGPLAESFGLRDVLTVGALLYAVVVALVLADRSVRALRRADEGGAQTALDH